MLLALLILSAGTVCKPGNGRYLPQTDVLTMSNSLGTATFPAPDTRSATSIAWSCFATIFACTWAAVHPNVPHPMASDWQILRHRAHLMFWGLIAPELIILWAIRQWMGARFLAKELNDHNFTRIHGYLAQMGGFMLYKGSDRIGALQTLEHLEALLGNRQFVYGRYIIRPTDVTFQLPTRVQIEDKCKGDGLSKALSLGQVWWFAVQCISRWTQGLTLTELELVTLAFAMLNGAVYFLWWDKPLKIRIAFPVVWTPPIDDTFIFENFSILDVQSSALSAPGTEIPLEPAVTRTLHDRVIICFSGMKRILFENPEGAAMRVDIMSTQLSSDNAAYIALLVASAAGIVFGGIHCVAWDFIFPSMIEQKVWRLSSLIITIVPLILHVRYAVTVLFQLRFKQRANPLFYAISSLMFIYILARTALLLEAFATLRDLQPGARTQLNWVESLPHI